MTPSRERAWPGCSQAIAGALVLAVLLILLPLPPAEADPGGRRAAGSPVAAQSRAKFDTADRLPADVAVAWFDLIYALVRDERLSPPVAARTYGAAAVALYEAIVPGMPQHRSLAGQLNGLASVPRPAAHRRHHWPLVANAALARIGARLFGAASADALTRISALEAALEARDGARVPRPVIARSVAHGRSVAEAIFAWASTDGYAELAGCPYTPPVGPGLWEPTPPAFAPALEPCWGRLRPMVLATPDACPAPPPTAYSESPASAFFAEAFEVYDTVFTLTPEEEAIARFWSDDPGRTGTPPGHWMAIVGQLVSDDRLPLDLATEAYARVGLAVADAFITCWRTKYLVSLLRPVTYIEAFIDAGWLPILPTPPFPEYTSGHSVQSGAAAAVLGDLFGTRFFVDRTHVGLGMAPRAFASFEAAAAEAAISRLYGGIHYRPAIEAGVAQGACVGQAVLDRVRFRR